jgi:hypothetical protein
MNWLDMDAVNVPPEMSRDPGVMFPINDVELAEMSVVPLVWVKTAVGTYWKRHSMRPRPRRIAHCSG